MSDYAIQPIHSYGVISPQKENYTSFRERRSEKRAYFKAPVKKSTTILGGISVSAFMLSSLAVTEAGAKFLKLEKSKPAKIATTALMALGAIGTVIALLKAGKEKREYLSGQA